MQELALAVVWRMDASVFAADGGEVLPDDPDDPLRTLIRQATGGIAQFERAMIIKRVRDGRRAKAAQGGHAVGRYPFGWGRDGEVAAEQATLALLLDLRRAGGTYKNVPAELDRRGLRPRHGERWSASSVRSVAVRSESWPRHTAQGPSPADVRIVSGVLLPRGYRRSRELLQCSDPR